MFEDISHCLQRIYDVQHYHIPNEQTPEHTIGTLELLFNANSTSVTKFNMPSQPLNGNTLSINRLLMQEFDYNISDMKNKYEMLVMQLNTEQKIAYDRLLQAVISG